MKDEQVQGSFDMDSAVADVAEGLGFTTEEAAPDTDTEQSAAAPAGEDIPSSAPPPGDASPPVEAAAPVIRPPPKSWAKDYHEDWSKLTPKQQEYIEKREKDMLDGTEQWRSEAASAKKYRSLLEPYQAMFASQGIQPEQAVQYLLNAQYRLTHGTMEERAAAYQEMGRNIGLIAADPNAPPPNPELVALRSELDGVKSALTQRQQADLSAAQAKARQEVDAFASDPAHEHFNEVSQDMVPFINAGLSLKDAYEKVVWANPITREKLLVARQTAEAAKLKEQQRAEGEAARKATSLNVRGVESRKAPTEPKGSMEDTMRSTLKEIRGRVN